MCGITKNDVKDLAPTVGHNVWVALKTNLIPGAVTLVLLAVVIILYYLVDATYVVFAWIEDLKNSWSYGYSALATSLFGGLFPFIVLCIMKQIPRRYFIPNLFFYLIYWAFVGVEVDLLYTIQGIIFGYELDPVTIICKVIVDQFIFNPFINVWILSTCYHWRDLNFDFRKVWRETTCKFYFVAVPSLLASIWMLWIPAVSGIYMMPSALQIPLFNLVVFFSNMIIAFVAVQASTRNEQQDSHVQLKEISVELSDLSEQEDFTYPDIDLPPEPSSPTKQAPAPAPAPSTLTSASATTSTTTTTTTTKATTETPQTEAAKSLLS
ncbi:hypothetical protein Pelo_4058 [Pelomyxa schiedti]|nr:hypothetical protein Pelo_4058 [Pelomyxa schiedti]